MTPQEIDRKLATDVMMYQPRVMPRGTLVWATPSSGWMPQADWSPSSNIAQAFECAEKLGKPIVVQKLTDIWECNIIGFHRGNTPALAISRAILAAIEKGK